MYIIDLQNPINILIKTKNTTIIYCKKSIIDIKTTRYIKRFSLHSKVSSIKVPSTESKEVQQISGQEFCQIRSSLGLEGEVCPEKMLEIDHTT